MSNAYLTVDMYLKCIRSLETNRVRYIHALVKLLCKGVLCHLKLYVDGARKRRPGIADRRHVASRYVGVRRYVDPFTLVHVGAPSDRDKLLHVLE